MNRADFIEQLYGANPFAAMDSLDLINLFDQKMVAYELVKDIETGNFKELPGAYATFRIEIKSDQYPVDQIISEVNDTIHNHASMYGRSFRVVAEQEGPTTIQLSICDE